MPQARFILMRSVALFLSTEHDFTAHAQPRPLLFFCHLPAPEGYLHFFYELYLSQIDWTVAAFHLWWHDLSTDSGGPRVTEVFPGLTLSSLWNGAGASKGQETFIRHTFLSNYVSKKNISWGPICNFVFIIKTKLVLFPCNLLSYWRYKPACVETIVMIVSLAGTPPAS